MESTDLKEVSTFCRIFQQNSKTNRLKIEVTNPRLALRDYSGNKGNKRNTEQNCLQNQRKIEKPAIKQVKKTRDLFKESTWLENENNEQRKKTDKQKFKAILQLKSKSPKELKSFPGAIQYIGRFLPGRSEKTHCK